MKNYDYMKIKLMLCRNKSPELQEEIHKLSNKDLIYEYIKTFETDIIPKMEGNNQ